MHYSTFNKSHAVAGKPHARALYSGKPVNRHTIPRRLLIYRYA